ncbi:helix-turn-helix domain-containing protein [Larkinella sp. GY13]|uniref:helix-turn-helix domain-containing protein n=1 Tax=Larkinella sp. GY13 TaxID=3453720 RepID=UPI003EEA6C14
MELSERIKAIREEKRIKLSEMATALGVDVSNYAKIEKKGKKLTLERIEEIADALGVSLAELLGYQVDGGQQTVGLQSRIQELANENETLKADLKREKTEKDVYMNIVQSGLDLINTLFKREKKEETTIEGDKFSEEELERLKEAISFSIKNKVSLPKS